jgi:hypothetical protein
MAKRTEKKTETTRKLTPAEEQMMSDEAFDKEFGFDKEFRPIPQPAVNVAATKEIPSTAKIKKIESPPVKPPVTVVPKTPKNTDIAATKKDLAIAATKAKEEQAKLKDLAKETKTEEMKKAESILSENKPLTGQESPETLLASLNTKMEAMLRLNSRFVDLASRQLTVQQSLSGNLLKAV